MGPRMNIIQKNTAMGWNVIREISFNGVAIDSPSRIAS